MITNFAASVRARLYNKSKDSGVEFQLLLARYAGERFLYRLGVSSCRDRCILKGATLLVVWMEEPYRSTRDIDLLALGYNDETSVQEIVKTVCAVACPEDGLTFDLDSVRISPIRAQQQLQGQRVRMICRLEQARIPIQIDFGFGDVVTPAPHEMSMSTLLKGIPAPVVRVYPMVTSLAEKFDAMVSLGERNSRMKDFYDVWALSEAFTFAGKALREAIHSCFERRKTPVFEETPVALTLAFYSDEVLNTRWRDYRYDAALLSAPPESFTVIGERVQNFFGPVHESLVANSPFDLHWPPGGPWESVAEQDAEDRDHA
ncbi:MAG: nucleotidyl transferase AbiEii/AbiGii toxin family protein [Gemmatimonadetes bacterium]|nr:nucleotidyl transferase AbiEii/AbiGii toxin family protein [Gemmatimonadota bacterium]